MCVATATSPQDEYLQDNVLKAKTSLMGDRVDALLQWKRSQEGPGEDETLPIQLDTDFLESDDERNMPDGDDNDDEEDYDQSNGTPNGQKSKRQQVEDDDSEDEEKGRKELMIDWCYRCLQIHFEQLH